MGYAPDWNKGSMKKAGATPVKHGVTSRELFHGAKAVQKFEDGGAVYADPKAAAAEPVELNIRGQKVGKYDGNDEIVKYRMNMTDDVGGKSLRYKDNPDMMAEKPMPEVRPYDSIDAIIDAKGTKESKKSDDGGAKFLASQANKATTAITAPKSKNVTPALSPDLTNTRGLGRTISQSPDIGKTSSRTVGTDVESSEIDNLADSMRSRMLDASPARKPSTLNVSKYRQEKASEPMHNEAEGNYEQLRQSAKKDTTTPSKTIDRNNRVRLSGESTPNPPKQSSSPSLLDTLREGMATTVRRR